INAIGKNVGPYKIVAHLGAGGMGEVYLAHDSRLSRKLAIKVLPDTFMKDEERARRFKLEARAASALNHPNVATIYEIGAADEASYIAMEYVEGETLVAKIRGSALDTAEILDVSMQIADALDEAHAKGIIHRDIKPANIMITARGLVKVLDFGLAKVADQQTFATDLSSQVHTNSGMVMGTVQYMSPEQALGRTVDQSTDIFSLGVVMYELATHRRPFGGANATETIDQIIHTEPEAISSYNGNVPSELERIVHKCMEKDVEKRYRTAREL